MGRPTAAPRLGREPDNTTGQLRPRRADAGDLHPREADGSSTTCSRRSGRPTRTGGAWSTTARSTPSRSRRASSATLRTPRCGCAARSGRSTSGCRRNSACRSSPTRRPRSPTSAGRGTEAAGGRRSSPSPDDPPRSASPCPPRAGLLPSRLADGVVVSSTSTADDLWAALSIRRRRRPVHDPRGPGAGR